MQIVAGRDLIISLPMPNDADDPTDDSVARAADGDHAELERLLRSVESELRARVSINPIHRRSLEVDDVLQVSFLEAFLRVAGLRDRTLRGFTAWIQRIVRNNLVDAIRALERDKRPDPRERLTHGPKGDSARTLFLSLAGEQGTAGGQVSLQEELASLHRAVKGLPPVYRAVVEQVDLAERAVADVAEELGRSRGAVHLLRRRAHDRLAELLRPGD